MAGLGILDSCHAMRCNVSVPYRTALYRTVPTAAAAMVGSGGGSGGGCGGSFWSEYPCRQKYFFCGYVCLAV